MPSGYEVTMYRDIGRIADALERQAQIAEAEYLRAVLREGVGGQAKKQDRLRAIEAELGYR